MSVPQILAGFYLIFLFCMPSIMWIVGSHLHGEYQRRTGNMFGPWVVLLTAGQVLVGMEIILTMVSLAFLAVYTLSI